MNPRKWFHALRRRARWRALARRRPLRLYAGSLPAGRPEYAGLVGLAIKREDARHLRHDITAPLPLPDGCVDTFQAEDVFEHIPYARLPAVVDEVYRVLRPGGLFRLSVPDYGCDVLRDRSEKDAAGRIVFDPRGGGTRENPSHLWFPRVDTVRALLEASRFGEGGAIEFLHYYEMDGRPVTRPIDYAKGYVQRTPDHDDRVRDPYRPMSLVVDLVKGGAP